MSQDQGMVDMSRAVGDEDAFAVAVGEGWIEEYWAARDVRQVMVGMWEARGILLDEGTLGSDLLCRTASLRQITHPVRVHEAILTGRVRGVFDDLLGEAAWPPCSVPPVGSRVSLAGARVGQT
jgi:hypothetical protein